jgi:hypothetical protein
VKGGRVIQKIKMMILAIVLVASCGGTTKSDYVFTPNYPEKLKTFADGMAAHAVVMSGDDRVLSAPSNGEWKGGAWHFRVDLMGHVPEGSVIRIDFMHAASQGAGKVLIASAIADFREGHVQIADPGQENYDMSADDDGDGVSNIDELMLGFDVSSADTDGDGVSDGDDAFPLDPEEWSDTDVDGIGDNSDDDIDGDGIDNEEEMEIGTDPRKADSDSDGVDDGVDICPVDYDDGQEDADGDGIGDACDDDADGDGLSNGKEEAIGTDPLRRDTDSDGLGDRYEYDHGTNPLKRDTDGDGVSDKWDNCPVDANPDQKDSDGDGAGDACDADIDGDGVANGSDDCEYVRNPSQDDIDGDGSGDACDDDIDGDGVANEKDNCPMLANPDQGGDDYDGDGIPMDCDLDDKDEFVGDGTGAVFVDGAYGSDASDGARRRPFATIDAALKFANGRPVYVAGGEYDASGVALGEGQGIFGGFLSSPNADERFSQRDPKSADAKFKTILTRSDVASTLSIASEGVIVDGFYIENSAGEEEGYGSSSTVRVQSASPVIINNHISGNQKMGDTIGLRITGGSAVVMRNFIEGGGTSALGSRCAGLALEDSSPHVVSNIIKGGGCRFAAAFSTDGSSPVIVGNVLDGTSQYSGGGSSRGIDIEGSEIFAVDNLIISGIGEDSYAIVCHSVAPGPDSALAGNVLAAFYGGDPVVVGCDGEIYYGADFEMGDASVTSNASYAGESVSEIVDGGYVPMGAGASLLVDAGADVSAIAYADRDCMDAPRPAGAAYDIGAIEK